MNYTVYLLTKLLQKYENSRAFRSPDQARRILLHPQQDQALEKRMENPDEKDAFLAVLKTLKTQGILDYDWQKFERGNLVETVWLRLDGEDVLHQAYRLAGLEPRRHTLDAIESEIQKALSDAPALDWVQNFYTDALQKLREKQKPLALMPNAKAARDLIRALQLAEQNAGAEIMERVFSLRCYGDTKYFEQNVKTRLCAVLKTYLPTDLTDDADKDEALAELGIVKWPEVMEFCGPLAIRLPGGAWRDYGAERFGAYINAKTAATAEDWQAPNVRRVLFIENKANYTWYIEKERTEGELVIYHGGHYSPVRGRFFSRVMQAASDAAEYLHWSDIDIGGFRIFLRLRENIAPRLSPYRMDAATLTAMHPYGEVLTDAYRKQLEKLTGNAHYALFQPVIEKMLTDNIRLEQECFLY